MQRDDTRPAGRLTGPALFAVACAACVVFAAGIVRRPVEDLVGFVSDDAFYYLQTARNLADTGRPTFDGVHATNGYHPGWMAVVTALATAFPDRETLLRAVLWTSFALHLASAALLVRLCARFVSSFWAWVLGAVWAVSPLPVTLAMQGVEAPLAMLALVWVLDVLVSRYAGDAAGAAPPATRDHVRLGVALGCLFLARTDGAIAAVVTLATVAVALRRGAWLRPLLVAGATAGAFVAAWAAWSLATVGAVQQDSAAVKMLWASAGAGEASRAAAAWSFVAGRWLGLPASLLTASPGITGPLTTLAFLGFVAWSTVRAARRGEARALVLLTVWLAATTTILGVAYGALLTDQMVWYAGPPGVALFLTGTLWAAHHLGRVEALRGHALQVAGGAALVVGAMALLSHYGRPSPKLPFEYPWQRDVLASQRGFDAIVPAGARIGCFNAGIPAYFGTRTVVNLDGLVNHDLVDVYRRGELDRWLADERIAFIADEPLALGRAQRLTKGTIRVTPVSSAPLRGWLSPTRFLWRVEAR